MFDAIKWKTQGGTRDLDSLERALQRGGAVAAACPVGGVWPWLSLVGVFIGNPLRHLKRDLSKGQ